MYNFQEVHLQPLPLTQIINGVHCDQILITTIVKRGNKGHVGANINSTILSPIEKLSSLHVLIVLGN